MLWPSQIASFVRRPVTQGEVQSKIHSCAYAKAPEESERKRTRSERALEPLQSRHFGVRLGCSSDVPNMTIGCSHLALTFVFWFPRYHQDNKYVVSESRRAKPAIQDPPNGDPSALSHHRPVSLPQRSPAARCRKPYPYQSSQSVEYGASKPASPRPSLLRGIRFEVRSRDPWSLPPNRGFRFDRDYREWRAYLYLSHFN